SSSTGTVTINGSTTFSVGGVSLTRDTDPATPPTAGPGGPGPAVKFFEDLVTQDSAAAVRVGSVKVNDSATLSGANNPTGTITFKLTAPPNLGGGVVYTDVVQVSGNGTYSTATMGNNPGGY